MTPTDTPLRVLIVEDSEDDCTLLVQELKRGGYQPQHERVDNAQALEAALDRQAWDIVFGDYRMPNFSGTQALARIRARGLDVPYIFVSGTIGEDTAVSAMKAGAQDFIMKGSFKRLLPAVERELRDAAMKRAKLQAEAEQRASEARFRNVLTMAPDAIICADEDQRIVIFNQGAERIFGYAAAEVEGQLLDVLLPPRYLTKHRQHIAQFAQTAGTARPMNDRNDVYGRRKNGEEFPAEASISRLTENGRTTFTVIMRDITERKRTEEEMRLLQGVTEAAAAAEDVHDALNVTLRRICETTGWSLAQAWIPNTDGTVIECSPAWYARDMDAERFRLASTGLALALGEGIPGRVLDSKRPCWIADVTQEANFTRRDLAQAVGIKAAMGVPVLVDNQVLAVLEFFIRTSTEHDARAVQLVSAVATQLASVMQRKLAEQRLHHLAHHDPLTDLPNRTLFNDRLRQAMYDANRYDRLLGVAFLDLDRFKTINDSLGHGVGDRLLQEVATRLWNILREGDTVARLSGDEFAIILTGLRNTSDAVRMAEKIVGSFVEPFRIDQHELHTGASVGVTVFPIDERNVDGLLRNADIAMYRAKKQGGGGYQFYAADMSAKAHERLALENDLRHALTHDEFRLHYQPIVDLTSDRVIGVEALLRWQHPTRGLVPPLDFIPLAEETRLIVRIGEWVLRTACVQLKRWGPAAAGMRLAVNVSPRQFEQPDFAATTAAIVRETGFDPALLDLEITESLLMQNAEATLSIMDELNAIGMQFSIDDFGTGYSSLSYLKRLPISRLKIDRSFVRDVPADKTTRPSLPSSSRWLIASVCRLWPRVSNRNHSSRSSLCREAMRSRVTTSHDRCRPTSWITGCNGAPHRKSAILRPRPRHGTAPPAPSIGPLYPRAACVMVISITTQQGGSMNTKRWFIASVAAFVVLGVFGVRHQRHPAVGSLQTNGGGVAAGGGHHAHDVAHVAELRNRGAGVRVRLHQGL